MAAHESQMPFIRNLASSDRKLRVASLDTLKAFLAARPALSDADAQKLWTGLFFAMWMTDRPKPQQALASDLAALAACLPTPAAALAWLRGFWLVVCARWTDIDVLRLDKYLLLVRRVFAAHVALARDAEGAPFAGTTATGVLEILRDFPFDAEGDLRKVPVGVRLHVIDLWVDELEREGALPDKTDSDAAAAFVRALGDMVDALRRCPVKPARERAAESHADARLPWGEREGSDAEGEGQGGDDDDEGWGGFDD